MSLLRTLVLAAPLLVAGACSLSSHDCGPFPDKFKTTGFTTSVHRATFSDSLGAEPMLAPIAGDTLRAGHLAVQMQAETKTYISRRSETATLQVVSSAHACSPVLPTSDEVIRDLDITSDVAFGDEYPVGDDLSPLFDVVVYRRSEAYGRRRGYRRYDLNDFLDRDPPAASALFLILEAAPSSTTRTTFTVEYEQDGKGLSSYAFTTAPVVLPAE